MHRPTDNSPGRDLPESLAIDGLRDAWATAIVIISISILPACQGVDSTEAEPWRLSVTGDEGRSATLFRLTNRTDRPLRVQAEDCANDPSPPWLTLEFERETAALTDQRCACRCEKLERHGPPCTVCGVGCSNKVVQSLEPGGSVQWRWDGRTYVSDEVDGHSCTRQSLPSRGTTLAAVFCWSERGGPVGDDAQLDSRACTSIPFDYGTPTVEHRVRER